jgi:hypothetical protein
VYSFIAMAFYAAARLAYEGKLFRVLASSLWVVPRLLMPNKRRHPLPPELHKPLRFGPAVLAGLSIAVFLTRQA